MSWQDIQNNEEVSLANRALVESGHFADLYSDERLLPGMIPFAFDADLLELRIEAWN